jgi:hypothetical protein
VVRRRCTFDEAEAMRSADENESIPLLDRTMETDMKDTVYLQDR